jgi:6-phosphofructokinase 1
VLTGGGDAPGLNAVIRGVVKAANGAGYEVLGFERGYEGLLTPCCYRVLDNENTKGILHLGGTILGTVNRGRFVMKRVNGERGKIQPDVLEQTRQNVKELGLKGIICIGGDGSLTIASQLHEAGIPVVCVPKTIDNDLEATVVTFGFHSAVDFAREALDRLHTTAASHERVFVVEVMGRHAGWIATYAGIAGGADVILIPEIPWNFDAIVRKIRERDQEGRRFTLVVVAEGARWTDGNLVARGSGGGKFGSTKLGGIAARLADELASRIDHECRYVILGHLQRGGPPNTYDRLLATRFGVRAVRLVVEGKFGRMVSFQPPEVTDVPLSAAVNRIRKVPANGELIETGRSLGISFGDR